MCSSCGKSNAAPQTVVKVRTRLPDVTPPGCIYTTELLESYKDNLVWFKRNRLYLSYNVTGATLNSYTGFVLSALNFNNNCRYETELNEMSDLIDLIISIRNA